MLSSEHEGAPAVQSVLKVNSEDEHIVLRLVTTLIADGMGCRSMSAPN